ncbi:D-alanyl-D-alanine carboxypeptidase family protein [Glutamicibacter sp. NPDC087344]|uniref:D-alanyl-D-alanine carboxypeptidase family protein n=1 Tax=Glutamicibacter sp. NPDC087344 TaxID=3363994 RepID=UPI003804134E
MLIHGKSRSAIPSLITAALIAASLPFGAAQASVMAPATTSSSDSRASVLVHSPDMLNQTAIPAAQRKINRDPQSISVFVNKNYPLSPKKFVPKTVAVSGTNVRLQPEAAKAYSKMVKDAKKSGVKIAAVSGYRSYARQSELFNRYTKLYGKTYASRISAVPGTSEHQTGLAIDVGNSNGACGLQSCFEKTPVGKWVATNGYKYGFILRYPKGQESATGYAYEPWHFRYVGSSLAKDYRNSGARSFEAYYGLTGSGSTSKTNKVGKGTAKTTVNLNQRSGIGTGKKIIQTIPKGKTVKLTGSVKSGWYQVTYGSKTGWVSGTYLSNISTKKSTPQNSSTSKAKTKTTTANLNLRAGASTSQKVLLTIPKGKKVVVTGAVKSGWYPVKYGGKSGWVSGKYLR